MLVLNWLLLAKERVLGSLEVECKVCRLAEGARRLQ
jgi:hypothetical protein